MNKHEVTLWFKKDVTPVRIGLYQVLSQVIPDQVMYSYWDGHTWGWAFASLDYFNESRIHYKFGGASPPNKFWRGLASDPNA